MPRGRKKFKEGRVHRWKNKKANHGRKPSKGKKRKFKTASQVKKQR